MLYILRGLPGSGKTTFAKTLSDALACPMYAADDYFESLDGYKFDPSKLSAAHEWCQWAVGDALAEHDSVIVHNTCTRDEDVNRYIEIAKAYNHRWTVITIEHRHDGRTVHGDIPLKTMHRMEMQLKNSIILMKVDEYI